MTQYTCTDCDHTFTAPTDTETVACPGCGEMAEQQPVPETSPAYPNCERCGDTGRDPEQRGAAPCPECQLAAVTSGEAFRVVREPAAVPPADPTHRDRIADVLTPFFANFSDEESARMNAGEAAAAVAAVPPERAARAAHIEASHARLRDQLRQKESHG